MFKNLRNHNLLTLLIFGLIIRLLLAHLPGFKIDTDAWFAWALRLNEVGFGQFYSEQVWTNYTPGFLYVLHILGFFKNLFELSNGFFYYLLKLPAIFSDLFVTVLIFNILKEKTSLKIASLGSAFYIFNPVIIFNSAIWGQIDSILTLFILLSTNSIINKKFILSGLFFGLAFLIKPQAIALIPALIIYFLSNFSYKSITKFGFAGIVTILLLFTPFLTSTSLASIPNLIMNMAGDYPFNSLFAFNFWGIFGFWINDQTLWQFLNLQTWGLILFTCYFLFVTYFYLKKRFSIITLVALFTLGFYFLLTRVHERYLFPAIPLLIILSFGLKNKLLIYSTGFISLIHFINLYYVYIYYNQLYLKQNTMIYIPSFYNFIGDNLKILSFISLLIFTTITVTIFKISKHEDI